MIRQRYPTRRPVRRLLSNRWIVTLLGFLVLFAFYGVAEGACYMLDVAYDPRIGAM